MDDNLTATYDACNTFNSYLKDTVQGLIGANNKRKSEIDALRGDHDTLRKDHDSFVTSAERENEMSDQRNGSDDQQSRRMEMERPQQLIQLRAVSTPQGNKTFVTQKASNINELSSLELSSIANIVLYCELSSLRNGSKVDHDTISNVSGFCNPPIRDLSEEEEGDSTSDDANHGEPSVVEESRPGICGLSNLGNTCYMNSIIQTLSNIPAIAEYFKNDNYEKDVNEDNPMGMKGEVARAFGQLIKDMWSGKFKHVEPHNFKMVVGRFKQRFSDDQQQDSEEFLSYLLNWLHEDLNRKLSYLAGMFLEDEREVTGIQEDVYFKKKHSLLLLDPKAASEHSEAHFNERAEVVDEVPAHLLELMQRCITLFPAEHNTLVRFARLYHRHTTANQPHQISVVEALDGAEVVWSALEVVRQSGNTASADSTNSGRLEVADQVSKAGCLHKWGIMPTPGPFCTEDIVRVMKVLLPVLNSTLHSSGKGNKDTPLSVEGPLTWRQFHRMAGVTTKGNTDDGCEPLPIPTLTVGHEKEFISVSPSALSHWDALSLEPWGPPRDIAYVIVCPDNDNILSSVKGFFKQLNNTYSRLKLGKHLPIAKTIRDGILRVGGKQAAKLENESDVEDWFSFLGDTPNAEILKLYAKVCVQYLVPFLSGLTHDATLLRPPPQEGEESSLLGENKENIADPVTPEEESKEPPAIVIYMVDPLSFVTDNPDLARLSSLALLRCFHALVPKISSASIRESVHLQTLSLEAVFNLVGGTGAEFGVGLSAASVCGGRTTMPHASAELNPVKANPRSSNFLRGLAFSVFAQSNRRLSYLQTTKTLTGFGPASTNTRFLKGLQLKDTLLKNLYSPPYILAPPPLKNKKTSDAEGFGSSNSERSTVLFVHYCLSDDQRHLLASLSDDRGELVKTTVINIEIPNRTRRKKASARRVGLSRLWDWILSVLSLSLVPWRLVIGRLGRIGHGELRGWSVLLSRKSLKRVVKLLKDECPWKSDLPCLLSVCLVSIEPDGVLRVMSDQFTPDPRFGGSAAQCALSTPRDTTATHILVFPTSATAQSSQAAFNEHQEASANDDLGFGLDIDELNPTGNDDELGFGDLNDIFSDEPFNSGGMGGSPGDPQEGGGSDMAGTGAGGQAGSGQDPAFKYGQEEPGERLEILQQPLALGYLTSTAPTGDMPRWFWSRAPHLESTCPVFLKNSLHINVNNLALGGDDGFTPQSASARVHSLDSNYTTDVLRYVLEGYNAMSWLVLDPQTRDRVSCLPIHVQALLHLYHAMAAIA